MDGLNTIYAACRQCYFSGWVGDQYPFDDVPISKKEELIKRVIESCHHSVLEHVSFTFAIKDFSRAGQQQLTRHRIGVNFSVQSMRNNDVQEMGFRIPDSIKNNKEAQLDYVALANSAVEFYKKYTNLKDNPIPREDARDALLLSWNSNLVMTMNCREFLHYFNERLCSNAQQEIRILSQELLKICQERLPEVFNFAGPKCKSLGYCTEGTRSCHKAPLKEEVFYIYNQFKDFEKNKKT